MITPFLVKAPAKVNFRLDVLKKRPDGYHELRMLMQRIDLCDDIEILLTEKSGIEISCNLPYIPRDRRNIVWKAAEEMLRLSGKNVGIKIKLEKNIPVGAGLGGGSSDGASTLMALNELLGTALTDGQLMEIGVKLGADVPFFIFGKPAIAEGIGEKFTLLENLPEMWILLVNPGIHVSTSWVYQNLGLTSEKVAAKLPIHFNSVAELSDILSNDLETVTIGRYPLISKIKNLLTEAGAKGSLMSGSGSTVFALFESRSAANDALQSLPTGNGWFSKVVTTI
ncbi:MAG: 4-(cytidine 5'-diphospho)-2-C-methyl-D-erythritol kinase [Geobacteraceae bacterium]|nr:4-(cytidine 5'-diphospho)-2-C-methyl-D-erythritol kinase [Geobacteraceae bacterium]